MKTRPNKNEVLDMMRDDDFADPWGTAMSWAWAVCEILAAASEYDRIPPGMGYRPSIAGPLTDPGDYPTGYLLEHLGYTPDAATSETLAIDEPLTDEQVEMLAFAARCLNRYLDWCKAAGKDY